MNEILTVTEAAQYLKRTVVCLQQWDRRGKLKSHRTQSNRRFYFKHELDSFLGIKPVKENRSIIAYARVSSSNQKPDLRNQINTLNDYIKTKGYSNVISYEEIGGGLNFKRKKFNEILNLILENKVEKLIITHKDRLCRFGYELVKNLCDRYNVKIEVITLDNDSPETEMLRI